MRDQRPLCSGRIAASTCLTAPAITPPSSGSPLASALAKLRGLLERDVRRQRRHLGIGLHLQHHRPVAGQRLVPRGAQLLGIVDSRCPAGRSSRRSGDRARRESAARRRTSGSPSITRCSHVTWFRSSLLNTQQIQRGSAHCCQYLATVISSAMLFICMAPSPTSAITGRSGMRELRRDGIGHGGAHRREAARQRAPSCRAASSGRARTSWRTSRSRW